MQQHCYHPVMLTEQQKIEYDLAYHKAQVEAAWGLGIIFGIIVLGILFIKRF